MKKVNFLIVDDSPELVELIKMFLGLDIVIGGDWQVGDIYETNSSFTAKTILEDHLPDVLITDFYIDTYDNGYTLAKRAKEVSREVGKDIKILLVTGRDDKIQEAMKTEAKLLEVFAAILKKPFCHEQFGAILSKVVAGAEMTKQVAA